MFDLQVLALQGDVTRVITFQLARETSTRTYPEIGVPESAPPAHPQRRRSRKAREGGEDQRIPRFAVRLFPGEAEGHAGWRRLAARSFRLPVRQRHGQPDVHDHVNLPILVAGGGAASSRAAATSATPSPTPLANLHLTLLDKVGVRLDSFADSKGKIPELLEPAPV